MRWQVEGAHARSGDEVKVTVDAPSAEVAEREANRRGVLVSAVHPISDSPLPEVVREEVPPADLSIPKWLYGVIALIAVAACAVAYVVLRPSSPPSPVAAVPPTPRNSARPEVTTPAPQSPAAAPVTPATTPVRRPAVPAVVPPATQPVRIANGGREPVGEKEDAGTPRTTLGISYDDAVRDLSDIFPMQPKKKADGSPFYEGRADKFGMLHVFGDKADISETAMMILMPPKEQELTSNLRIVQTYLRNVVPGWDAETAMAWFQTAVGTVATQPDAKPSVVVGERHVWLTGIPTNEGLAAFVGVKPATASEIAAKTGADVDLERALARGAAAQRKVVKTLGMSYAQVLAGLEDTFDMKPAEPADGLPGFYGSTKNEALTIRVSGDKPDVAAVGMTLVLGGEKRDGITNVVAMSLVVANVLPEWKGFLDWLNENKVAALTPPHKPVTKKIGNKTITLTGLTNKDFNAQMLFVDIKPAE